MKKQIATLCAAVMALSVAGVPTAPAISAPVYPAPLATPASGKLIEEVNHRHRYYARDYHRYRKHRHRSRRGNAGAFLGGLAAGAILGGLLSQSSRAAPVYRYRTSDPHVQWCLRRYRSYDVRTDTFQPYSGPRKYCNSPYR
ncbi:BA14K family protein [Chelativorans salis]|uniref:Lectin-like protein BA14k n=1 Tax=Chelativorans salis TaxID=2978478 RepID=A0ABT2LPC0_9HYPH|nr:BA14K family protein [Chelativorans sp. EGI FJ00035]MCT7375034.1 BA14K family protein [Chelativorans sp. EGI FJ00035]